MPRGTRYRALAGSRHSARPSHKHITTNTSYTGDASRTVHHGGMRCSVECLSIIPSSHQESYDKAYHQSPKHSLATAKREKPGLLLGYFDHAEWNHANAAASATSFDSIPRRLLVRTVAAVGATRPPAEAVGDLRYGDQGLPLHLDRIAIDRVNR